MELFKKLEFERKVIETQYQECSDIFRKIIDYMLLTCNNGVIILDEEEKKLKGFCLFEKISYRLSSNESYYIKYIFKLIKGNKDSIKSIIEYIVFLIEHGYMIECNIIIDIDDFDKFDNIKMPGNPIFEFTNHGKVILKSFYSHERTGKTYEELNFIHNYYIY